MSKILRLKLYQPYAHYREPKIMQDDYIPTLPLPPATTIAGMVSYMIGRKLNQEIDIAVCGTYKNKEVNFIRGENIKFWENYYKTYSENKYSTKDSKEILIKYFGITEEEIQGLNKKKLDELVKEKKELKKAEYLKNSENFILYKTKIAGNRIMNFELLSEVELTIYLKIFDDKDYEDIKAAFEEFPYYLSLGRKEDFAIFSKDEKIEDITEKVEEKTVKIEEAIKDGIILKNTYIRVSLNDQNDEYFLNQGVLFALSTKYEDIKKDKTQRKIEHSHFIYVDERGIYPKNKKVSIYKNGENTETFCWMLRI